MYHMDISLFERMINNNVNCATLTTQYRMRPEIANLIRPAIYPDLLDSDKVASYPDVIGVEHNLFFIDHENLESKVSLSLKFEFNLFKLKQMFLKKKLFSGLRRNFKEEYL